MSQKESSEAVALGCLTMLVTIAVAPPWRAWCLIRIYDWHLRPIFGGPHLGVIQVWALCVFWGLLTMSIPQDVEEKEKSFASSAIRLASYGFIVPLLSLFIAWLLRA